MQALLLFIVLIFSAPSWSQTFYESPFVVNGTSFRITIPPGFEEMNKEDRLKDGNPNIVAYTTQQLDDVNTLLPKKNNVLFFGTYETNDTLTAENATTELINLYSALSDSIVHEKDTFVTNYSDTFIVSKYTMLVSLGGKHFYIRNYSAETQFDSITFSVHLGENIREGQTFLDPSFFYAILKSYRTYNTDRKSTFIREEDWNEQIHSH
ncbi:MAG: hypothetical protein ACFHU9_06390 [Fluviicola sp.]